MKYKHNGISFEFTQVETQLLFRVVTRCLDAYETDDFPLSDSEIDLLNEMKTFLS